MEEVISSWDDLEYVNRRLAEFILTKARSASIDSFNTTFHDNLKAQTGRIVHHGQEKVGSRRAQIVDCSEDDPAQRRLPWKSFPIMSRCAHVEDNEEAHPSTTAVWEDSDTLSATGIDLSLVSPDSQIPCTAPNCPIKSSHNLGRYYHEGEQSTNPAESEYGTRLGGIKAPVAHVFNYTVPPPGVVAAYLRMTEEEADGKDRDIVRAYQMNHMYSPLISEYPSPTGTFADADEIESIPCLILTPGRTGNFQEEFQSKKLGDYHKDEQQAESVQCGNKKDAGTKARNVYHYPRPSNKIPHPLRQKTIRLSQRTNFSRQMSPTDFGYSGNERDDADDQCTGGRSEEGASPAGSGESYQGSGKEMPACTRQEVPHGSELTQVQTSLWEKIILEIASQAKGDDQDSLNDEQPAEAIDREIEVLTELMKKVRCALNDGTFKDFVLLDLEGHDMQPGLKFEVMRDILAMLQHSFGLLLSRFPRDYRPTGKRVRDEQQEELFVSHLEVREAMMLRYPEESIQEMIHELEAIGHEAELSQLC